MAISSSFFLSAMLVAIYLVSPVHGIDFEYCNKRADYPVKVTAIDINPDPIRGGELAQFNITASTADIISRGKVDIDVQYFFLHVHSETKDLCEETSCPVTTGDFVLSHQQTLPSLTPPGSYWLTMKIKGEDKKQLSCITFGFTIGFGLFASVADI